MHFQLNKGRMTFFIKRQCFKCININVQNEGKRKFISDVLMDRIIYLNAYLVSASTIRPPAHVPSKLAVFSPTPRTTTPIPLLNPHLASPPYLPPPSILYTYTRDIREASAHKRITRCVSNATCSPRPSVTTEWAPLSRWLPPPPSPLPLSILYHCATAPQQRGLRPMERPMRPRTSARMQRARARAPRWEGKGEGEG